MDQDYLKKIYIKAKRRGIQEMDILLGNVADKYLKNMSEEEVKMFADILEEEDSDILKWILKQEKLPSKYNNAVWKMITSYKVSFETYL